jgi:hypothetical protein
MGQPASLTADALSEAVTLAIERARAASEAAARAWEEVARYELSLAKAEDAPPNERAVGNRGHFFALRTANNIRRAELP